MWTQGIGGSTVNHSIHRQLVLLAASDGFDSTEAQNFCARCAPGPQTGATILQLEHCRNTSFGFDLGNRSQANF